MAPASSSRKQKSLMRNTTNSLIGICHSKGFHYTQTEEYCSAPLTLPRTRHVIHEAVRLQSMPCIRVRSPFLLISADELKQCKQARNKKQFDLQAANRHPHDPYATYCIQGLADACRMNRSVGVWRHMINALDNDDVRRGMRRSWDQYLAKYVRK